uniref:tRNA pseudouridine synthase n=1 Tax=Triatoma infestans TaxID=30076 RepID=A0A023F0N7_TRIIF
MKRYLIYFSYLGTQFRGLQKQYRKGTPIYETETIQSILEIGLKNLKNSPLNEPVIYPASRTDQGVHALCTAAHVDLEFENDVTPVYHIISNLNTFLTKRNYDIRILSARVVPEHFSARYSVVKKRYTYRFAVLKPDVLPDIPNKKHLLPIPIIEKNRCLFTFNPAFDHNLVKDTANIFVGLKDFRSFMSRISSKPDVITERFIESLELKQGQPLIQSNESDYYNFWEISCSGKSFLYKQVRRIVGILLAVGLGRVSPDEVQQMLNNPIDNPWIERAAVVPGYGLYLTSVEYSEEDLLSDVVHTQQKSNFGI